jgi:alkylhydroperoxidase family enzyme
MPPTNPRISPLPVDALDDATAALLPRIVVAGEVTTGRSNIMRTLVRHPALFERWTPLCDGLLNGRLPDRTRELLVLRTAWNCGSEYEWGQHVAVGRKVGLTDNEIERTRRGPKAPGWDAADALLLRVADELKADCCVSEETWRELARGYDEQQLIEIVMVVGHYAMVAMTLNSLGVPRDDGLLGFDEVAGAPS